MLEFLTDIYVRMTAVGIIMIILLLGLYVVLVVIEIFLRLCMWDPVGAIETKPQKVIVQEIKKIMPLCEPIKPQKATMQEIKKTRPYLKNRIVRKFKHRRV